MPYRNFNKPAAKLKSIVDGNSSAKDVSKANKKKKKTEDSNESSSEQSS